MASRLFVAATPHRIATASTASYTTVHTQIALVTVASIPGAGVYPTAFAVASSSPARDCALCLNGDSSGTLSAKVGTTRVNPSTNMIPVADGRWYLMGAAKNAGTVAVDFFMYDFLTGTWTEFSSSGTVANRTVSAAAPQVGCLQTTAGCYWDGRVGAAMHLPVALGSAANHRNFISGRASWIAAAFMGLGSGGAGINRVLLDLTIGMTIRDLCNTSYDFTTGTIPVVSGTSTPPGW